MKTYLVDETTNGNRYTIEQREYNCLLTVNGHWDACLDTYDECMRAMAQLIRESYRR